MYSLEPSSVLVSQGPCHQSQWNILSRSRSRMLLGTFLLLQTLLKQTCLSTSPSSLYAIPPWARQGFMPTAFAKLMQPGIRQLLISPQQLDNVCLFPQNYSHSSWTLVAQKCKGFKQKAYGGCTSASACCNWGGIFVGVWMAPPHRSPCCGDPIDGNPGVLETRLWYLNGPHKGLKAYFTPFKNMNTCKGQPSAQLPAQPPGFHEDNVFFSPHGTK